MSASRSSLAILPILGFLLVGIGSAPVFAAQVARIRGTASYRERVALTPEAVFEATLEDASRAGARGRVIARVHRTNPGQVPIAFVLSYNPRRIDSRRSYVVRATLEDHGRRFTGSEAYQVLTRGQGGGRVTLLLRRTSAGNGPGTEPPGRPPQAGLENTRWRPIRIGDQEVIVSGQGREPWIELDPRMRRVTGSGGCNRISGDYQAGTGTLRFDHVISTQMACISMATESALVRALNATRGYRIAGRSLELLDEGGRRLAVMEERNL